MIPYGPIRGTSGGHSLGCVPRRGMCCGAGRGRRRVGGTYLCQSWYINGTHCVKTAGIVGIGGSVEVQCIP